MKKEKNNIWTKDFTILTMGSIISLMGTSVIYFVMGYLILDQSNSVLNYSLYLVTHNVVGMLVPLIAGTFLDKCSRKKTIYTLDYISAALYFIFWIFCKMGLFKYWMAFIFAVVVSITDSIYRVAFKSLFPMLVNKEQLSKAYALLSAMETFSLAVLPVAVFFYKTVGLEPVLQLSWFLFGIAATVELFIKAEEKYVQNEKITTLTDTWRMFCEGFSYVRTEKALLIAVVFELMVAIVLGTQETILLPYCNDMFKNGYLWYCLIAGGLSTGNFWGSGALYLFKIPKKFNFLIFANGAIVVSLASMLLLNVPIWAMIALELLTGTCQMLAVNIRNTTTQSFLEDNRKARYNGVVATVSSFGLLVSQLLSGIFSEFMSLPLSNIIICGSTLVIQIIVYYFVGYNTLKNFLIK